MGAVKDMVCGMNTLADDSTMDIKPSISGEEWVIHNIYIPFGKSVGIYRTDGVRSVLVLQTTMSLFGQFNFHCNVTEWIALKNDSGATIDLTFDGVVSNSS